HAGHADLRRREPIGRGSLRRQTPAGTERTRRSDAALQDKDDGGEAAHPPDAARRARGAAMSRGLDWRWMGIGVAIMFGLNLVAGLLFALAVGDAVPSTAATPRRPRPRSAAGDCSSARWSASPYPSGVGRLSLTRMRGDDCRHGCR
ncbi:MAG: hypothetical protein ACRDRK_06385, partial [Pseudonocardia sp.]